MIFLTVGSQMPFGRLVRAVDSWAGRNPRVEVVAQVGPDEHYAPQHLQAFAELPPDRYAALMRSCDLVVGHAGMGTVLTAIEFGKPMLLMARRHALHETRNDHQVSTLRWLMANPGIHAADDEAALAQALDAWRKRGLAPPSVQGMQTGSTGGLIAALRTFIG